jgi:hypothetical protein
VSALGVAIVGGGFDIDAHPWRDAKAADSHGALSLILPAFNR